MAHHTAAILLAAGVSRRMGGVDKVWAEVRGRPLLAFALERLAALEEVEEIVVVAPGERHIAIGELAFGLGVSPGLPLRCVAGGEQRRDSVAAGLAALPDARWLLVHDSARPLASSGLASRVLEAGTGTEHPAATSRVVVHYTGWTTDGRMFDSSVVRGQPALFPLNGVIRGWTEGVQLMVEGEKRRFWIPANLAYGENPGGGRPGGLLVFDVELIDIR
jgi:2-C-methyl-D-erythritol 4-phosphate cytidylyltransferase